MLFPADIVFLRPEFISFATRFNFDLYIFLGTNNSWAKEIMFLWMQFNGIYGSFTKLSLKSRQCKILLSNSLLICWKGGWLGRCVFKHPLVWHNDVHPTIIRRQTSPHGNYPEGDADLTPLIRGFTILRGCLQNSSLGTKVLRWGEIWHERFENCWLARSTISTAAGRAPVRGHTLQTFQAVKVLIYTCRSSSSRSRLFKRSCFALFRNAVLNAHHMQPTSLRRTVRIIPTSILSIAMVSRR